MLQPGPTHARLAAVLASLLAACAVIPEEQEIAALAGEGEPAVPPALLADEQDTLGPRAVACDTIDAVDAPFLAVAPPTAITPLPVSETLEPRVAFWTHVWGEQSEQQVAIVDADRPWLVWARADCRTLTGSDAGSDTGEVDDDTQRKNCGAEITGALREARDRLTSWADAAEDDPIRLAYDSADAANAAAERLRGVRGRKEALERGWARAERDLFQVESLFALEGVPASLARTAIIESLWRTDAVSRRGAVGAFQFTRRSGQEFLRIDDAVDERLDLRRQGMAAAKYLKRLHRQFKKACAKEGLDDVSPCAGDHAWALALTAYNTGPARLKRVMRDRGTGDLGLLASAGDHRGFGFDGQNYFAQIAAVIRVTQQRQARPHLLLGQTFAVSTPSRLEDLSVCTGVDVTLLAAANPALKQPVVDGEALVPDGYVLFVPHDDGTRMASAEVRTATDDTL